MEPIESMELGFSHFVNESASTQLHDPKQSHHSILDMVHGLDTKKDGAFRPHDMQSNKLWKRIMVMKRTKVDVCESIEDKSTGRIQWERSLSFCIQITRVTKNQGIPSITSQSS